MMEYVGEVAKAGRLGVISEAMMANNTPTRNSN